jgi:aldehyde dehydrogenase (NAD+)
MNAVAEKQTSALDIPAVVAGLRRGFETGRTRPRAWRDAQLARLDAMLAEGEQELAAALEADMGKSPFATFLTELSFTRNEIAHVRKHLERWMRPERVRTPMALQPGRAKVVREPLGVVLVIAPWNYPLQLALGPLAAALAAGNCVVVKPSEVAPRTSAAIARLVSRYLDREAVVVVEGGVPETTALLEQRFDHIFYTGNGTVGRVVMTAAARHLTPVTLELGGKSPTIVDATADVDVAARRIVWGKFLNAGQTCVAPDHILVERRAEERLIGALVRTIREFFGEDPRQSPDYGRIINARHLRRLVGYLGDGDVVCGGVHDENERYLAPTVLRGVRPDAPIMNDEIFGPILPILPVSSVGEAIAFVNARPKPLALYVFTGERRVADEVLERTSSGGACVNDVVLHLAVPELPFGGVGESGMGAYHGRQGFETFSHRKAVLTKIAALDVPVRYPPYDETKKAVLKRLV